ncbi:MbtH protein [Micromonospora echinospora]|uniref:MbtH protein n=1 Tax=Micromonospora echinospora TaxID=1877 RepID=A0ABR6MDW1_MICEC|nr:MbtH family protein [Micromonospora echinospora]MBB5113269.1 MbtH protein [Micromonospora echinospora]
MSGNPFDDAEGRFLVLTNDQGQHSLWPAAVAVPAGWTVALAESERAECVRYVERNWTDLRRHPREQPK